MPPQRKNEVKRLLLNITRYFLPILFVSYLVSFTFFAHVHVVNGVTIVHSHPFKKGAAHTIVLAKGKQLLASGVGQTSRGDALKQAIEKAKNFGFDLNGAVMASDAFFPFPDCVEIAGNEGVTAVIQPGGSIKDELSFEYCNEHGIAMVTTGFRHFKH